MFKSLSFKAISFYLLFANSVYANGNSLYIEQIGSNTVIQIQQTGKGNTIAGTVYGTSPANVLGNNNSIGISQGTSSTGNNQVGLTVAGNNNQVAISQERDTKNATDDTDSLGNHSATVYVTGDGNAVILNQQNNSDSTAGNSYTAKIINGQSNVIVGTQDGSGNKTAKVIINNSSSSNIVETTQTGNGQHTAEVLVESNMNTIGIHQTGNQSSSANIAISPNSVGPTDFTLIQSNGTAYGTETAITQECMNPSGCSIFVDQQ